MAKSHLNDTNLIAILRRAYGSINKYTPCTIPSEQSRYQMDRNPSIFRFAHNTALDTILQDVQDLRQKPCEYD